MSVDRNFELPEKFSPVQTQIKNLCIEELMSVKPLIYITRNKIIKAKQYFILERSLIVLSCLLMGIIYFSIRLIISFLKKLFLLNFTKLATLPCGNQHSLDLPPPQCELCLFAFTCELSSSLCFYQPHLYPETHQGPGPQVQLWTFVLGLLRKNKKDSFISKLSVT